MLRGMPYLAEDFRSLLPEQQLRELQLSGSVVVGLRADNTVGFTNAAWARFAKQNNGGGAVEDWRGSLIEAVSPELRGFYLKLFETARATGEPQDHRYQCSDKEKYREFMLRVLPLPSGALILIHHKVLETPHGWERGTVGDQYRNADGFVVQCSHCRRTRRADDPLTWDWVPAYLERQAGISHGLCGHCFRHYYEEFEGAPEEGQL